ncbi:hypothetical protein [Affinirhizobium pseudoryzae]|uniref:hypothetical protein n=1 Tax=Allorhizobium pseudoryzae TaxID=379684 RepID=UPI001F29274D|nr:hypothetical protein [Allorhizobium pseudoryzae]
MGALTYIPDLPDDHRRTADSDLDWFADQVELVQPETDIADIDSCKEIKPDRVWEPKNHQCL